MKAKSIIQFIACIMLMIAFAVHSNAQVNYYFDNNGNRVNPNHLIMVKGKKKVDDTNKVRIFPNPTPAQVNVSIKNLTDCPQTMVYVLDNDSRVLASVQATQNPTMLDISRLAQGIYYIKVVTCDEEYTNKIIKVPPGTEPAGTKTIPTPVEVPK